MLGAYLDLRNMQSKVLPPRPCMHCFGAKGCKLNANQILKTGSSWYVGGRKVQDAECIGVVGVGLRV